MASSVRDVAARAGVSVGTVSNVLNRPERVAPETAERVQAVIAELGFVRNDAARQLRAGRSRTLGLVVLDAGNPFFAALARGAGERAGEEGLAVLLGDSWESSRREADYLDLFETQQVRGVLLSPVGEAGERLLRLRSHGVPVVLVDRRSTQPGISSVSVDDVAGGRLAVQHLLAAGRRRIAFVGGPPQLHQVRDRLAGARAAAADAGVEIELVPTEALGVDQGRAAGQQLAERPPARRPDGVFAANDLLAVGLLQALVMLERWRVPEDVALIGYDDIDFAAATVVPLSSVRQPSRLMGRTAVELLLADDATAGQQVEFQPELVVRRSTTG